MKEKILQLGQQGKTYKEICSIVGCSKSVVCYYLGKNQSEKRKERQDRRRRLNPLLQKIESFSSLRLTLKQKSETFGSPPTGRSRGLAYQKPLFTLDELLIKLGARPSCYLTGIEIDLSKPETYSFDHIIPVSKGGDSSLDNLGLTSREANKAKSDLSLEDFLDLCKVVLEYHKSLH